MKKHIGVQLVHIVFDVIIVCKRDVVMWLYKNIKLCYCCLLQTCMHMLVTKMYFYATIKSYRFAYEQ